MAEDYSNRDEKKEEIRKNEKGIKKQKFELNKYLPYILILLVLVVVIVLFASLSAQLNSISSKLENISSSKPTTATNNTAGNVTLSDPSYKITGSLIVPPKSLPNDPIITANASFGSRLTNINQPLNASELAIFNNANDSYFEEAGQMILNGTFGGYVFGSTTGSNAEVKKLDNPFVVNGKPSVIYLGSITCIYCGENRWAMALALGRFGNFSELYKGYSSFGDHDIPTIYWAPSHYNQSAEDLGNFYSSKYINFISIEDTLPITGGFQLNPMSTIQSRINATNNSIYIDAFDLILGLNNFEGTPYTIWGKYNVLGADDADFGFKSEPSGNPSIEYKTHNMVFDNISHPDSEFGYLEYAGADLYIAMTCATINNTAPICSLPVIPKLESYEGYN
ncbi:DUF929 family protein [Candidatus Mancarchaeum acidiphilum]|nr:DUF929 family protein [Candidatus Mancarchaeum acidiphilum]